jgi:hypothetical protein
LRPVVPGAVAQRMSETVDERSFEAVGLQHAPPLADEA